MDPQQAAAGGQAAPPAQTVVSALTCPVIKNVIARKGRKYKRSERLLKYLESTLGYRIFRFQACNDFGKATDKGGRIPLNFYNTTVPDAKPAIGLPMYCFNLGTMPMGVYADQTGAMTSLVNSPLFRLFKVKNSADDYDYVYTWIRQDNYNTGPDGAAVTLGQWVQEYYENKQANALPANTAVTKAYHAWDDIKLLIYGSTINPSIVHTAIGKFTYLYHGPVRGVPDTYPAPNTEDNSRILAFWDKFFARKLRNPLIDGGLHHVSSILKFSHHKSVEFCPTVDINKDVRPKIMEMNISHPVNQIVDLHSNKGLARNTQYIVNNTTVKSQSRIGWQAMKNEGNNQEFGVYPKYTSNDFLFIWANNPIQEETNAYTPDTDPSFDLLVRSKWETNVGQ